MTNTMASSSSAVFQPPRLHHGGRRRHWKAGVGGCRGAAWAGLGLPRTARQTRERLSQRKTGGNTTHIGMTYVIRMGLKTGMTYVIML